MKNYDVIVVGGSAAGITAAITARKHFPDKEVLLIRREMKVPIPCGIPYIFGTVMSTDKNLIPDGVLEKNGIDFVINEAVKIDRKEKTVLTSSGESYGYDRLILATGSKPSDIPIPGTDKKNVFKVRKDVPYLDSMLGMMDSIKDLVIIGGGFIGMEFADECRKNRDINISLIEMLPHCLMLGYDESFCKKAEEVIREEGVKIYGNSRVKEIIGDDKVSGVVLSDGTTLKADAVILAVGVKPNVKTAVESGLKTGPMGALLVDYYMRTEDPSIFACGDCAESTSFFTGKPIPLMLASVATMEARVAGANLYGLNRENPGEIGVFSTKIGKMSLASAGLTERTAIAEGFDVVSGEAQAINRHPGGMSGAAEMSVKLVFNAKNGVLLGCQACGPESVGEFINAVSPCIQHRMTADDIAIFQCGTHPALTASPIAYQLTNAAESAIQNMKKKAAIKEPVAVS